MIWLAERLEIFPLQFLYGFFWNLRFATLKSCKKSHRLHVFAFACNTKILLNFSCSDKHVWLRLGVLLWTHLQISVYVLKFFAFEHVMPCALEINDNDGFKWEHVESCPLNTKTSPLSQCIWPTNPGGWRLTLRVSHP